MDDEDVKHPPEISALLDAIRDYTRAIINSSDTGGSEASRQVEDRARDALGVKLAELLAQPRPLTHRPLFTDGSEDAAAAEAALLTAAGHRVRFKLIEHSDGSTSILAIDAGPKR